jgi:hypothetical protein
MKSIFADMRKVLFALLFVAVIPSAYATGEKEENKLISSFEIIVVDAETEEPVPAAKIKIGEKEYEAYTDFDGFAEFKDLVKGEYNIEVSFVSYEKQQIKAFQLDNSSNRLLIKLKP